MNSSLEESIHSKEETSRNLVEIVARSQIHEQDLAKLQLEVNELTQSEAESRVECEKLRYIIIKFTNIIMFGYNKISSIKVSAIIHLAILVQI